MKKILIISFSDLKNDPRVYKQMLFLKDRYKITAVGFTNPEIYNVHFIETRLRKTNMIIDIFRGLMLIFGFFKKHYWFLINKRLSNYLAEYDFDLIIANDIEALVLASDLKKQKTQILWDAHECIIKHHQQSLKWKLFNKRYVWWMFNNYINYTNLCTTESDRIAVEYERYCDKKFITVNNLPFYSQDLNPTLVNPEKLKIIHHGGVNRSRKMEIMIEMMKYLDNRFELFFMIKAQPTNKYFLHLKKLASKHKNIYFVAPVSMTEISKEINKYDIGLFILPPTSFHYANALANKFFEFIQGRLALAIGPSPQMEKIVSKYDLGIVAKDFTPQAMAEELNKLTLEKIMHYKQQSHKFAYELSAEKNREKLQKIVRDMIGA